MFLMKLLRTVGGCQNPVKNVEDKFVVFCVQVLSDKTYTSLRRTIDVTIKSASRSCAEY